MSEIKERYFGEPDPFDSAAKADMDDNVTGQWVVQETPQAAALRQAKLLQKSSPKPTRFEELLEERTKQAVEGVQHQLRIIVHSHEVKEKKLSGIINLYADAMEKMASGEWGPEDLKEFLRERKKAKE